MQSNAKLTSYLVESINGIETVKAFNAEEEVNLETEKRFVKLIKNVFKNGWINNLQGSLKNGIKAIFAVVILWIGGIQVLKSNISMGELLTFNALHVYFLSPIENSINLQPMLQTAVVAGERFGEILDLELEKSVVEDKKINSQSLKGTIEFIGVDFRYGTRKLILKDNTLDHTEIDLQKKSNEDKIETINQDVENLKKLKSCILDDKNNDKVKDYYNKYLNDLNSKIDAYYLLQKSVNEDKRYVPLNTLYSEQYNNYKISQKQLKDKIEDSQKQYNSLKLIKNVDKNSIMQPESVLNASKTELDKFTSDYKLKINSTIEDLKSKNKELNNSLNKINDTSTLNKEKNKSTTSVQLEDDIKVKEEKLKDLEDNSK